MKATLSTIGILGLLLSGSLFILTFGVPQAVEQSAKNFVKQQLERELTSGHYHFLCIKRTKDASSVPQLSRTL